tara:strand:- start:2115 stop:2345 length:231 start_codon:yes stop_codon:yes gene_type:complete
MDLSKAQLRVLKMAQSDPEHQYNGRIRRTVEILEKHRLVTSDWWPVKSGYRGDVTETWQVTITDAGREWLALNGGK